MKKNKMALLLAMALTLTQSVEMTVPVAASELEAETSQKVVQEETGAEDSIAVEKDNPEAVEEIVILSTDDAEGANGNTVESGNDGEDGNDDEAGNDSEDGDDGEDGDNGEAGNGCEMGHSFILGPAVITDASGKAINPKVGESLNLAELGIAMYQYEEEFSAWVTIGDPNLRIIVTDYDKSEWNETVKIVGSGEEEEQHRIMTRKTKNATKFSIAAEERDSEEAEWHECAAVARVTYEFAEVTEAEHVHTVVKDAAVAATCETPGKTEGSHCSECGKVLKAQETIPAKDHTEVKDAAIAPTALVEGKTEGSHCSVCGTVLKKQDTIAKLTPVITLTAPNLKMRTGQSTTAFRAKEFAAGDYVTAVTSSNPGAVKVTEVKKNGTFRLTAGKKKGNATVTITLASGRKATFKVTVQKGAVKTTKITTSAKSLTLTKGDTYKKLASSISVTPVTSREKITYTSSNKKVATVSKNGVIRAKKAGTAKITVKSGKKKVVVTVKVKAVKTTNISGVPETKRITKGKTFKIKAVAAPKNTDEKITFKSSNTKVATVTSKGVVKGKKKGTATITVQSGSKKVTCKVTVK